MPQYRQGPCEAPGPGDVRVMPPPLLGWFALILVASTGVGVLVFGAAIIYISVSGWWALVRIYIGTVIALWGLFLLVAMVQNSRVGHGTSRRG